MAILGTEIASILGGGGGTPKPISDGPETQFIIPLLYLVKVYHAE
jgi:hypothetical protein